MTKTEIYAARDLELEGGFKAKKGDVVATLETDLPHDRFFAGMQMGTLSMQKPAADDSKDAGATKTKPKTGGDAAPKA